MARQSGRQQIAIGKNPERSRDHNRRVVLDVVRMHGSLGRMHIAKLTQLTAQAVANIVDELVGEDLLMEIGRLRSGRGQPPIQFAVNPDGAVTIGIEIAADHVVTTVLDLSGRVRSKLIVAVHDTRPEFIVPFFARQVEAVRAQFSSKLLGIGVVMPGPFEIEGMSSVGPTTLPGWGSIDAAAVLSAASGETVIVENDANAAAVSERLFGAGRTISNFGMIYFGVGVGLGLIHDGAPFRGAFGNAGEIGHVVVAPRGRACACGQNGCLERYVSVYALKEKLAAAGFENPDFEAIEVMHKDGNPVVREWIAETADYLSPMVAMLENVLDPETLILGGALPDAVIDDIIDALQALPVSVASRRTRALPRVIRGQTGQLTAALGAAALPLFEAVTPKMETSPTGTTQKVV
jgi:predicted NBD/HSP70 family sugar kinase